MAAPPVPVIQSLGTSGQAPFTVHVHGLNSTLGAGNINTARFEWEFGDPSGTFNTLTGFNAAHTYDSPGSYTIKLTLTNQNGQQTTTTIPVNITSNQRSYIYVSPSGNDNNNGSINAPIKTFAKAATMLTNNRAILFQRGGTYNTGSTMNIGQQNVIIGAYGTGNQPIFNWTVNNNYQSIINTNGAAKDVLIENVRFTSPFAVNNLIVRGIVAHGTNITVRNSSFGNVSYAMNSGGSGGVNGFLTTGNDADVLGAYYVWGEGWNHVHVGNTVDGSQDEHNLRLGGANRVLIAHNNFTNDLKSTIWCMQGEYLYVANNTLNLGRFIAGPNFADGSSSDRAKWLVFENNKIINQGVVLYAGAEDMTLRNNVIIYNGGEVFSVWGWYSPMSRTCKNINIFNNTATNSSTSAGRFVKLGTDAVNIKVANNLYCAPSLNTNNGAANCFVQDNDLNSHYFEHNVWANPSSGSTVHVLNGSQSASQWANHSQTSDEMYRNYNSSDLNGNYEPQFNAQVGDLIAGVAKDFYGNTRPGVAPLTVGAVELAPGGTPIPPAGDINGDGAVNSTDLILVISNWGTCSGGCPADVNGDGAVNVNDLLAVLNNWS